MSPKRRAVNDACPLDPLRPAGRAAGWRPAPRRRRRRSSSARPRPRRPRSRPSRRRSPPSRKRACSSARPRSQGLNPLAIPDPATEAVQSLIYETLVGYDAARDASAGARGRPANQQRGRADLDDQSSSPTSACTMARCWMAHWSRRRSRPAWTRPRKTTPSLALAALRSLVAEITAPGPARHDPAAHAVRAISRSAGRAKPGDRQWAGDWLRAIHGDLQRRARVGSRPVFLLSWRRTVSRPGWTSGFTPTSRTHPPPWPSGPQCRGRWIVAIGEGLDALRAFQRGRRCRRRPC